MYQEILIDHYKNPRNRAEVANPSFCSEQRNSSCGDEITCSAIIDNNHILLISFVGKGCVISQATGSILSEKVMNMSCVDILRLDKDDLLSMIGITLGPVRIQCALLSLIALHKGIHSSM
jgi:nitrogen fixation NifU-like protein